jgi:hypothetical protein
VNGKKAQLETSADNRGGFHVGILSREFKALGGLVECGSFCDQPGAVRFFNQLARHFKYLIE